MAIRIVARDHIKPECVEEALKLLQELVAITRTEQGNISYTYCRDMNHPEFFAMLESWETQESLEAHMKSAHFRRIIPRLTEMSAEPTRLEVYSELF